MGWFSNTISSDQSERLIKKSERLIVKIKNMIERGNNLFKGNITYT
jgi:hypothetical protein